jgi:hypothetical protein
MSSCIYVSHSICIMCQIRSNYMSYSLPMCHIQSSHLSFGLYVSNSLSLGYSSYASYSIYMCHEWSNYVSCTVFSFVLWFIYVSYCLATCLIIYLDVLHSIDVSCSLSKCRIFFLRVS